MKNLTLRGGTQKPNIFGDWLKKFADLGGGGGGLAKKDGSVFKEGLIPQHRLCPQRVIAAYHKKIKQWPQIGPGDAEAYRKFYNFSLKCENITQLQMWNVLNTLEIMCMLLSKPPSGTRNKGSRWVLLIRRKQRNEAELADFACFVNDENLIVNDSVFSEEAVEQYIDKKRKSRRVALYESGSKENCVNLTVRSPCINCRENDQLDGCLKFMDTALKDRIKLLSKKKILFLEVCN